MKYQSTRNHEFTASSARAVLEGIAPDGGLYICDVASLDFDWRSVLHCTSTLEMSARILHALLPDFPDMDGLVSRSYHNKFETEDLVPLVPVGDRYVLELFRGPTSAFKDVALSVLPHLITAAKKVEEQSGDVVILTATSGDTGKAALEGFHDVPGTRIIVFYPHGGVSTVQQLQMTTQVGSNVKVCAVHGNFDDAQTGVKETFAACEGKDLGGVQLSSANSINIGRLAPQVMYYFKAYADLMKMGRIKEGDPVDYVVPTGNFGDILAGYFAKLMGLPVGKLVCASNANNVLTDFLQTGTYDKRRPFYKTTSPSMDILVSSNLERLLYLLSRDDKYVADLMAKLKNDGHYQVTDAMVSELREQFPCGCADDAKVSETIGEVFNKYGYLCDPHTGVGWAVSEQYIAESKTSAPVVVLSTASPYKFPAAVLSSLGKTPAEDEFEVMEQLHEVSGVPVPPNLAGLKSAAVRHSDVIEKTAIEDYVLSNLK